MWNTLLGVAATLERETRHAEEEQKATRRLRDVHSVPTSVAVGARARRIAQLRGSTRGGGDRRCHLGRSRSVSSRRGREVVPVLPIVGRLHDLHEVGFRTEILIHLEGLAIRLKKLTIRIRRSRRDSVRREIVGASAESSENRRLKRLVGGARRISRPKEVHRGIAHRRLAGGSSTSVAVFECGGCGVPLPVRDRALRDSSRADNRRRNHEFLHFVCFFLFPAVAERHALPYVGSPGAKIGSRHAVCA